MVQREIKEQKPLLSMEEVSAFVFPSHVTLPKSLRVKIPSQAYEAFLAGGKIGEITDVEIVSESDRWQEDKQHFMEEELPHLDEHDPRRILWEGAEAVEHSFKAVQSLYSPGGLVQMVEQVETMDAPILLEIRNFMETCESVTENLGELYLSFSHLGAPAGALLHKVNNMTGLLLSYISGYLRRGDFKDEMSESALRWQSYFDTQLVAHTSWMQQTAAYEEDWRSINDLAILMEMGLKSWSDYMPGTFSLFIDNEETYARRVSRLICDGMGYKNLVDNLVMNSMKYGLKKDLIIGVWMAMGTEGTLRIVFANSGEGFTQHMLEEDGDYGQRAFRRGETTEGTGEGLFQVWQWIRNTNGTVKALNLPEGGFLELRAAIALEIPIGTPEAV
jgi:hypothetical protein